MDQEKAKQEYQKLLNELPFKIMMQNMASKFSGKLEVWFTNGQVSRAHNNQQFGGNSLLLDSIMVYSESNVDKPEPKP